MNEEWRVIKSKISINVEDGFLFCGGWNFFKSVSVGSTFIREMRVVIILFCVLGLPQEHSNLGSIKPDSYSVILL